MNTPVLTATERAIVEEMLRERYGHDVSLELADAELRLDPGARGLTSYPTFNWTQRGAHFVVFKTADTVTVTSFSIRSTSNTEPAAPTTKTSASASACRCACRPTTKTACWRDIGCYSGTNPRRRSARPLTVWLRNAARGSTLRRELQYFSNCRLAGRGYKRKQT